MYDLQCAALEEGKPPRIKMYDRLSYTGIIIGTLIIIPYILIPSQFSNIFDDVDDLQYTCSVIA